MGSTDEISQISLSIGELNNKYREISPEQDEFSQIPIHANYQKVSQKIMVIGPDPISIT